MSKRKTIITAALTGAIHTPTMSAALPYTAKDITEQALAAAAAGAAILHLHARNPNNGAPSIKPEDFLGFLPAIKEGCDAVINISTGGSLVNTMAERIAPAAHFSPEMCSLNMGSINFAFHPLAKRYNKWQHDWEEDYVRNSEGYIFRNTFTDIAFVARELGSEHGVKFEHECYDVGHLYNLQYCLDANLFTPPIFIQFVLGVLGGIGVDLENLVFMKNTADRLFGDDYQWSVLGAGTAQMPLATAACQMGGNLRVGLEDSLYIERGKLATSSAEQVMKIKSIVETLGNTVATANEARTMLQLKGAEQTSF